MIEHFYKTNYNDTIYVLLELHEASFFFFLKKKSTEKSFNFYALVIGTPIVFQTILTLCKHEWHVICK